MLEITGMEIHNKNMRRENFISSDVHDFDKLFVFS